MLTANQRKVQTGCHFKTICQNYSESNQHKLGAYVHIHTKYKVSMTVYVGRRQIKEKVPKLLPFENCKLESLNI